MTHSRKFLKGVILSEGTHSFIVSAAVEEPALSLPKGPPYFAFVVACSFSQVTR
jgi:hypothetical protein